MTRFGPRRRRAAWLLVAWAAPAVGAFAWAGLTAGPVAARPTPVTVSTGQALYRDSCASCHGATGRGSARAPSLVRVGAAAVDFQLSTGRMPKHGSAPTTPPYRSQFTPAQIRALVRYVTAVAAHGGPGIPRVDLHRGNVAAGGDLFRQDCAACHATLGEGGELTDTPTPSVTGATNRQIAEAVRSGPAQMPVFGTEQLTAGQVDSIIKYVNSLKHPYDRGGDGLSHLGPVSEGAVTFLIVVVLLLGAMRWIGKRG